MPSVQLLLDRLDAIGASLAADGRALALIGLGSVGVERARLDRYSDLDFFAIVRDGQKTRFIDDLAWLTSIAPVAYAFRNTPDGYKLLYEDGVFCEFAVFERAELRGIPFAPGAIVWRAPEIAEADLAPAPAAQSHAPQPDAWLLGEALTNLYVGLGRYHRGEKLSALRFIQQYAVDRALELVARREPADAAFADRFAPERRVEQRFPALARQLPSFMQGYDRSRESAAALLAFLSDRFDVNPALARAIRSLCEQTEEL